MALLIYNKAFFGWELRRTIPIPKDVFEEIINRHAVRQITVAGLTYYYVIAEHYPHLMERMRASANLLGKDIPEYSRIIFVWTDIENPPETFESINKEDWFKELERDED